MRVLQLIDSLNAGGAERMAVSLANSLLQEGIDSYLCTTRAEGDLKEELINEVGYFFLDKKHSLDLFALMRLRGFVIRNRITVIHAHSSSFFIGTLIKLLIPSIRLVWHDHYGDFEHIDKRPARILRLCSSRFDAVISVNVNLKNWASKSLKAARVIYLPNFPDLNQAADISVVLQGNSALNIMCLANLRPQKDHLNLLRAFKLVIEKKEDVALHLIGAFDDKDAYYQSIREFLDQHQLDKVYLYGSSQNVYQYLIKGDIGVLASRSEGLPLALLEYGVAGLPVVCTDVGECQEVIGDCGRLVAPNNPVALAEALLYYINSNAERRRDANALKARITDKFSRDTFIKQLIAIYGKVE